MSDGSGPPYPGDNISVNGYKYIVETKAVPDTRSSFEQYGAAVTIVGLIVGLILLIAAAVAVYSFLTDSDRIKAKTARKSIKNDKGNWRCRLLSHKPMHERVGAANFTNVASAEVIYCTRCMKQLDIEIKPLNEFELPTPT